jgi:hypothetical protein
MNRANWEQFSSSCLLISPPLHENVTTETAYKDYTNVVLEAASMSIPRCNTARNGCKPVPYWNDACSDAIKQRNTARNRSNRTRMLDDCIKYRRLKAVAQRTLRETGKAYWEAYCSTLTTTSRLGSDWKMAKKMAGNTTAYSMPNLTRDGASHETNEQKANLLAVTYAQVSSNSNYSPIFVAHKQAMEEK